MSPESGAPQVNPKVLVWPRVCDKQMIPKFSSFAASLVDWIKTRPTLPLAADLVLGRIG